jgi:pyruvate dehydrogenase E2 component (dihydrolipoamide acetyltransferase)
MPVEITMPQLSDTMTEGTVIKWLKKEGDKVKAGDIIAEIETDKANMEMEAFESGTLAVLAAKEGDKVKVGQAIAVLATGSENAKEVKGQFASSAPAAESPPAVKPPAAAGTHTATAPPPSRTGNGDSGRLRISPLARRLAEERGVDIEQLHGSGPGGRITQRDVMDAAESAAPAAPPKAAAQPQHKAQAPAVELPARVASGQKETIPLTKMRATIAQRLQQSKQQVPHFYTTVEIDVEEIAQMRTRLNQQLQRDQIKLSIGDFVAKAVAMALIEHPQVNAHLVANEITRFGDVHLGMAVALPEGLIVPVLRNIDQMGLREIRQRSEDLVDRARAGRLKQDELTGATFTVSNLGMYGVREFSAIINPPEVGILAVSAAEKRPAVRGDQIVPRTSMAVTLSADHRAVDGATAAEFLRSLKQLLEEPGMMLV